MILTHGGVLLWIYVLPMNVLDAFNPLGNALRAFVSFT